MKLRKGPGIAARFSEWQEKVADEAQILTSD
jgi:hypothetical protein